MAPLAPDTLIPIDRSVSIVDLVAALIEAAAQARASDIHIDPTPQGVRIRVRTDGMLALHHAFPPHLHAEMISRIKVLAGLRTDEHQAPQDGRFRHTFANGGWVDIRVAIMPTYHGENAVLRLLSDAGAGYTLSSLGFEETEREAITESLRGTGGLILATGPTGSGKTTTLYTLLALLAAPEVSLITIEDPIEYAVDGVRQIQVNPRTGLTFSTGLRAVLRQDPDVIMVGEIRDAETAAIAVHTALTGHLVLSTLHAENAIAVLPRLLDLGVEPYLIASTLRLIIAQRLVRRLCPACAEGFVPPENVLARFKGLKKASWQRGRGCDSCGQTGYRGRTVVAEVLVISDELRSAIAERAPLAELESLAKNAGMRPLQEAALTKAARGETTLDEVLRSAYE